MPPDPERVVSPRSDIRAQPAAGPEPLLSIVVPVYNEVGTVAAVVDRLLSIEFPVAREVIVVDDGSTDGTRQVLAAFEGRPGVTVILAPKNAGKGAAIRRGIATARGSWLAIQDADLELDPAQLPTLVQPLLDGRADVVYGSRFLRGRPDMATSAVFANRALTVLTNMVCGGRVTDMETCYKIASVQALRSLSLESNRFDIEVEITAKLLLRRYRIAELPITVRSRTKAAGKKMRWRDGVQAIRAILRYGVLKRSDARR